VLLVLPKFYSLTFSPGNWGRRLVFVSRFTGLIRTWNFQKIRSRYIKRLYLGFSYCLILCFRALYAPWDTLLMHGSELCTAGAVVRCDRTECLFMHCDSRCGVRVDSYIDVSASRHSRERICVFPGCQLAVRQLDVMLINF
jgi:hypothetical protein